MSTAIARQSAAPKTSAKPRERKAVTERTAEIILGLFPDVNSGARATHKYFAKFLTIVSLIGFLALLGINTLLAQDASSGEYAWTSVGTFTPGTLFRAGLTFDGTTITANFNGGGNQIVAGVPTGLTTMRVGNNSAGTTPMFGECGYFDVLPYVIPAGDLPAAVSAIPS